MSEHTLSCWSMPECTVCGRRKAPRGRSVPMEAATGYCGYDCIGYDLPPKPGHFWPGEEVLLERRIALKELAAHDARVREEGRREADKEIELLRNGLESAWGIIANAGYGDWKKEGAEWSAAAAHWRDHHWHPALDRARASPAPETAPQCTRCHAELTHQGRAWLCLACGYERPEGAEKLEEKGAPDLFVSQSPPAVPTLMKEDIEEALEKGRRDAEAVRKVMNKGGYRP